MFQHSFARASVWCASILLLATAARADVGSLAEGSLVAWGSNGSGECNVPTGYFVQISAGGMHGLALRLDGNVVAWGSNADGQRNVPGGGRFTQVSAAMGGSHSLALRSDGNIAAWGYAGDGATTVPAGSYTQIAAGGSHSLAVKSNGALAAWGYNGYGECNVPAGTNYTKVSAGLFHSLALRSDGAVVAWGANWNGECNVPAGTYTQISAGFFHNLALRSNGSIAAWGDNGDGQCNVPGGTNFVQVAAGDLHSLAVRSDGTVAAWGYNAFGECNVPTGGFYLAVAGGWGYSLGLKARTSYQDLLVSGTGLGTLLQRSIDVSGDMTVQSPLSVANSPTVTLAGRLRILGGGSVNLQGATWISSPDPTTGVLVENSGLLRAAGGTHTLRAVLGTDANVLAGTTQVDAGASLGAAKIVQSQAIVGGTLELRGCCQRTTSVVNTLAIAGAPDAWTGTLDIKGNYLIVKGGSAATIENQVRSGLNLAGGYWDGKGITSSLAAADTNFYTSVGVLDNSLAHYTTFGDVGGLTGSEVLIRYTFYGDADLNGVVDFDTDYILWQEGFLNGYEGWHYGDFNHDGVVDFDNDYILWQTLFLNQPSLPAGAEAVPEPATLALLALGAAGALRRRAARAH